MPSDTTAFEQRPLFFAGGYDASTFDVATFSGSDVISSPYRFDITLTSDNANIEADSLVNKNATLMLRRREEAYPYSGIVTSFRYIETTRTAGGNELIMDDVKGMEKISLTTPYDMSFTVGHDHSESINNDKTKTVGKNETTTVKGNRTTAVDGTFSETVKKDVTIKVDRRSDETLGAISPAAKLSDGIIGVDAHTILVPAPSPVPVPMVPHPFVGSVFLWHSPDFPSANVMVGVTLK